MYQLVYLVLHFVTFNNFHFTQLIGLLYFQEPQKSLRAMLQEKAVLQTAKEAMAKVARRPEAGRALESRRKRSYGLLPETTDTGRQRRRKMRNYCRKMSRNQAMVSDSKRRPST